MELRLSNGNDGTSDRFVDKKFSTYGYRFNQGDHIQYDVRLLDSREKAGGINVHTVEGSNLRSTPGCADPDLRGRAIRVWHTRRMAVPSTLWGQTSDYWAVVGENDSKNVKYTAQYDNIFVTNSTGTRVYATIFENQSTPGVDIATLGTAGVADVSLHELSICDLTIGGNGLRGEYFDNKNFSNRRRTRVDGEVNFSPDGNEWGTGSPDPAIEPDRFSVRWTGKVQPTTTGTYTFYTFADDGVRLWVNNQPLVDDWTTRVPSGPIERSGTISLVANATYNIQLEYFDDKDDAQIKLSWAGPSVPKQVIPSSQLLPHPAASTDGITVDFAVRESEVKSMNGFLQGIGDTDPPSDKIMPLQPKLWRHVRINQYQRITGFGARFTMTGDNGFGPSKEPPFEDWTDYERRVEKFVRENTIEMGRTIIHDMVNEPDLNADNYGNGTAAISSLPTVFEGDVLITGGSVQRTINNIAKHEAYVMTISNPISNPSAPEQP